jgi:hypothetical protein
LKTTPTRPSLGLLTKFATGSGAESKRERYRARAKEILAREPFARARRRLDDLYWTRGQAILNADRLPQPLLSQARH